MDSWHIITGEYPPTPGGVADYTQAVARALARAGDDVHVWAPMPEAAPVKDSEVTVHALPDHFGRRTITALSAGLRTGEGRKRILLQYVPQAFGLRGMNLPFCAALASRREDLWVMFHEVLVLPQSGKPLRHNALAAVTHLMAAVVAYRANRLFVSIPAWNDLLKSRLPGVKTATWLPIPSNISCTPAPERVAALRSTLSQDGAWDLVGHFGTYSPLIAPLLEQVLLPLLGRQPRCKAVLLGRNATRFAAALFETHPDLENRILVAGEQSDEQIATHLAACDLTIQPYPDGISSRRTSVMASLALGVPVVSNEGWLSESIWRTEESVGLAGMTDKFPTAEGSKAVLPMADLACELLADRGRAEALGERGQRLYDRFFSLDRTVETLRSSPSAHHTTPTRPTGESWVGEALK